jgi:NHLM bacteriocin system ABC transporter ATP-binding protein
MSDCQLPVPAQDEPLDLATVTRPLRLLEDARLYITARDPDGGLGTRRFLATLPAGAAVHRLAGVDAVFLLVSARVGTRAPSLADEPPPAEAVDAWFTALLAVDIFLPGPDDAATVEHGQRLAATGPTSLAARSMLWVRAETPALSLIAHEAVPPGAVASCLPLSPEAGLLVVGGAAMAVVSTGALQSIELDHAAQHIGTLAGRWHQAALSEEIARRRRSLARDDQDFDAALRVIQDAVHGPMTPAPTRTGAAPGSLRRVLEEVAEAEDIVLPRPGPAVTASDWREQLAEMAAYAAFRARPVQLAGRWWREEGPSLIAEDRETGTPHALLSGRTGYQLTDPAGGRILLNADSARRFAPEAVMLYPSLPRHVDGRGLLRFAWNGIGPDFGRLALTVLAISLLGLFAPVAIGVLVGQAVPDGQHDMIAHVGLALVATAVGAFAFRVASALAQMRLITRIDWRLQAAVWDRVMRLPARFFRDYAVGDLAVRIRAIDDIRRTLSWVTVNGVVGGVFSLTSLILMFAYDASLGLLAGAYALVLGALLFVIKVKREALLRDVTRERGRVSGLVLQLLDGVRKLRVAAAEPRGFARWAHAFACLRAATGRDGRLVNLQALLVEGGPILAMAAAFAVAGLRETPIDVARFAAFSAAFGQFTAAIWTFANALAVSTIVVPMARRLQPVLDAAPEVDGTGNDPGTLAGRIAMRNVSFRYREDGPWILRDVTLDIEPGAFIAIVGPSGSGKSTILRLLLGFETPNRGSVFYDGQDLTRLDLRLVRRQIGTVLQSTGLGPGSLGENIAGLTPVSRERVMEAARMAGLAEDIAAMPMGLDTVVSEDGATLSGGQRQRVMIARALLRKPRILYFDEATSALDNRTQAVVSQSLARLSATRLVIAHRLSTVRGADRILVVEGGQIVEQGRFDDLMRARGPFHRLATRQML